MGDCARIGEEEVLANFNVGSFEHGKKHMASTKGEEFVDLVWGGMPQQDIFGCVQRISSDILHRTGN